MICQRLDAAFSKDTNADNDGSYLIHSLYFDDYLNSCANENEAGINKRKKYRIRYYGKNLNTLKLERKEKYNGLCHKDSCKLTIDDYHNILNNNYHQLIYEDKPQLLKEFALECLNKLFRPKAIIDYKRIAYVDKGYNIRITVDTQISTSNEYEHFLDGNYLHYGINDDRYQLLECKFDDILPSYVKHLLSLDNLRQTSFSKYYYSFIALYDMGKLR